MPEKNVTLHQALLDIQTSLSVPKQRVGETMGGHSFEYRNLDDILIALKPFQKKYGLVIRFEDCVEKIGETPFLKSTIIVSDAVESVNAVGYAALYSSRGLSPAQVTGACSTYARKYAANALFCLDDSAIGPSPDPDAQPSPSPEPQPAQAEQEGNGGNEKRQASGRPLLTTERDDWKEIVQSAAGYKDLKVLRSMLEQAFSFTEDTWNLLLKQARLS